MVEVRVVQQAQPELQVVPPEPEGRWGRRGQQAVLLKVPEPEEPPGFQV